MSRTRRGYLSGCCTFRSAGNLPFEDLQIEPFFENEERHRRVHAFEHCPRTSLKALNCPEKPKYWMHLRVRRSHSILCVPRTRRSRRSFESIGRQASVVGSSLTTIPAHITPPPNSRNTIIIILAFSQLYSSCSSMPLSRPRVDVLCSITEMVITQKYLCLVSR
ncbi:hypothetical protein BGW80DRAFT_597756 [Lactifluus volemus]|nr:hypothetical protein BGW80DRAFT_597756 [Lactifluus volemus]